MDDVNVSDKYILFLQLNEQLPHFYYDLAQYFAEFDLKLVPIKPKSLKQFSYINKKHIISIRHDLESEKNFQNGREIYIDYLLKHSKIFLTDISSFSEIDLARSMRLQKSYKFHKLPLKLQEIVIRTAYVYYNDRNTEYKWPGGKRGKFPAMPG